MEARSFEHLVQRLTSLPRETEWVEFKENQTEPLEIGRYISGLANAAALHGQPSAYLVWGVRDGSHAVVGTRFQPHAAKKGNEDLEPWLTRMTEPRPHLLFHEGLEAGKPVVVLEIAPARQMPVAFEGERYIRVGSYLKPLKGYPEKERRLWELLKTTTFEDGISLEGVTSDEVLNNLLDYPAYFHLTGTPMPAGASGILERLATEGLIHPKGRGLFDVTNLGGILFARDLGRFPRLARKALRVILYHGSNRVETTREQKGTQGYAMAYESAIDWIQTQLPANEAIQKAFRREEKMYPEPAVRELVANAIIHQDFTITGTGPMVEIFTDRMEITNPGVPLVEPLRFMDLPPKSRNEALAAFMRRMNICEERGSGIDKVVATIEAYQLPAPNFTVLEDHTRAVLFAPRNYRDMEREDRVRACYQHACLQWVSGQVMTNASLRQRLGIEQSNYPMASRVIKDTLAAQLAKLLNPDGTQGGAAKYIPFWA